MFFLICESHINSYEYSVFIKMKFVFQEIHKDPKYLHLLKTYMRFSHDCYMFRRQYKILVLCSGLYFRPWLRKNTDV